MTKYIETKNSLKQKALDIRAKKNLINSNFREGKSAYSEQWSLESLKRSYRKDHIAMSLARGKTMLQIEPNVSTNNALDSVDLKYIEELRLAILASWEAESKAKEEAK